MSLLTVKNLRVAFDGQEVVHGVSFSIEAGERVCLIGESGSGKSVTALAIDGLLPPNASVEGSISLGGDELLGAGERTMLGVRGKRIGFVFQEPQTALNPVVRIRTQLVAALRNHTHLPRSRWRETAVELAQSVGLPDPEHIVDRYPHELSGGQRQRVVIAMAMSVHPELLIADEPTTALDATVQARILRLMMASTAQAHTAMLMITHDMAVAGQTATRLLVMKDGRVIEAGTTAEVLRHPQHPYTANLVNAARTLSLS